ncbi:MAG: hypothetical protein QGH97_15780, partial [Dehalococcoidia bacterium]|nr:hypothetical protein [Dehalococcoidia bacterium]
GGKKRIIAGRTLNTSQYAISTYSGGNNRLTLVVSENIGWFFVNGRYVATLNLVELTEAINRDHVSVQVGTGFNGSDEIKGAHTSYKKFVVLHLSPRNDSRDVTVIQKTGYMMVKSTGASVNSLITVVEGDISITMPRDSSWDYGYMLEYRDSSGYDALLVQHQESSTDMWSHERSLSAQGQSYTVDSGALRGLKIKKGQRNHLAMVFIDGRGIISLNSQYVATIDQGSSTANGPVSVVTGFFLGDNPGGSIISFKRVYVMKP